MWNYRIIKNKDNSYGLYEVIYNDEGETKNDFTRTFYSLVGEKGRFMDAVSRQVGGVYHLIQYLHYLQYR